MGFLWWNEVRRSWQRHAGERALRRRLRRELSDAGIDEPTEMAEVCRRLGSRRGRPIMLRPYPFQIPGPFGWWGATEHADFILYQAETTWAHQQHIIAHELGHLLANHRSDDESPLAILLPDVPPEMIRRALRRTSYDNPQEREAEVAATILLETAAVVNYVRLPAQSARASHAQQALGDRMSWL